MNRSMPGLPVHPQLPEFTQTHVHRVSDAIQPSHPLSSPFPPVPNPSQHQSLFQWVNSLHKFPYHGSNWGHLHCECRVLATGPPGKFPANFLSCLWTCLFLLLMLRTRICHFDIRNILRASLVGQMVKHLPVMRETWVWSLGQEDPLEKEMATHSSTLAWKILWREEPGTWQSMDLQRIRHDWAASLVHCIVNAES